MHFDMYYKAGAYADCGEPVCCREGNNGTIKAGPWGYYGCDVNIAVLNSMFTYIHKIYPERPFDTILWTGDNPPHDVWEQSREYNLNITRILVDMVYTNFPNISVFPALGNHESWGVDQYHLPEYIWLNNNFTILWSKFLDAAALQTVREGLYYSTLAQPGLRIIGLNTQFADSSNFYWLIGFDLSNQTNWLINELTKAEAANEKVWLLGHIPCNSPNFIGNEYCLQYIQVIARFNNTITGQMFGHTHHDQFALMYDSNNNTISAQLIAPSVTTDTDINPSFRIYMYDKNTFEILDVFQYYMNVTQANINNYPTWNLTYQATIEYGITDLTPTSLQSLYNRLSTNSNLFQTYVNNFQSLVFNGQPCTGGCRMDMLVI